MAKRYNLINIRTLLKEGFSDEELRDFCFDAPDFRPVYDQLAQNTGKAELVRKLLEYAHQKLKLELLLAWAEKNNPSQFKACQPYSKDDPLASDTESLVSYLGALREPASPRLSVASPPPLPASPPRLPVSSPPLHIFLCHASSDKPAVRDLYYRLRADGFEPWLDEEDLLPGQKWQREIPKAVHASDVVIICLSRAALTIAGYVQEEIKFALDIADQQPEETIFLIPVRLEECDVPQRLLGLHWVNLFEERGYGRLVRALKAKAEAKAEGVAEKVKAEPKTASQFPTPTYLPFEPEVILIPAGEFLIGSDSKKDKNAWDNEQPQHTLYLPNYYLAKTPVTNTQYAAFVQATDYEPPQHWHNGQLSSRKENPPVVYVSWRDALAYCRWLAETTGKPYTLPSEAEWEKGARGVDGRIYPWGNQWDAKLCNSIEGGKSAVTPVDAYPQGTSPYGLLDMAGNVWEWMRSRFESYPYDPMDGREDLDKETIYFPVLRGGSFDYDKRYARAAVRYRYYSGDWYWNYGFRVVLPSSS